MSAKVDPDLAIADVKSLLRSRHKIDNPDGDPDKDDFLARSAEQATEILGTVTMSLTAFLGLVAGISLIVGGIGIMNIMLVSVTERTREIGIRKSIGAKRRDIMRQFLLEAIFLCQIGGMIGILLGALVGNVVAVYFDITAVFPWTWTIGGVFMVTVIALVFGGFPAYKAARLDPIESLRYE